jgi:hypothetical protein
MTKSIPYTRLLIAKDRSWFVIPTFIINNKIHGIGYNAKHPAGHGNVWDVDLFEDINWDRVRKL